MSQGDLKLSVEACTAMLQQLAASDCDDASEARLVELALAAMRQAGWRDPEVTAANMAEISKRVAGAGGRDRVAEAGGVGRTLQP